MTADDGFYVPPLGQNARFLPPPELEGAAPEIPSPSPPHSPLPHPSSPLDGASQMPSRTPSRTLSGSSVASRSATLPLALSPSPSPSSRHSSSRASQPPIPPQAQQNWTHIEPDPAQDPETTFSCHCGRPDSADDLIGCDNVLHPDGWFHLGCVDLSNLGEGEEWFCGDCNVGPSISCECGEPDSGAMICCEGAHHEEGWYHLKCAGLRKAPRGSWVCRPCREAGARATPAGRAPKGASAGSRGQGSRWTEAEEDMAITAMRKVIDEGTVTGDARWEECSRIMKRENGVERSGPAIRNDWIRSLRERSGLDERSRAPPSRLTTGVQKRKREEEEEEEEEEEDDDDESVVEVRPKKRAR
ncbi:MAG: hypothetical protein M1819_004830 [Sarea resinae]|nr:MAG: hypothetical protein M1819_004830 [Sarea resinae]